MREFHELGSGRGHWPRWVALGLAALTIQACRPGTPVQVVKATLPPLPPSATPDPFRPPADLPILSLVTASGERVPGTLGGWSWGDAALMVEVQPEPGRTDPVNPGEPIQLEMAGPPPGTIWLSLSRETTYGEGVASIEIASPGSVVTWEVDVPPGRYVLAAMADWADNQGNIAYYFGLTVEGSADPGFPAPPPLYLKVGEQEEIEGLTGTYCWTGEPDASGQSVGLCADAIWPPQHAAFTPLPSAVIRLRFEHTPPGNLSLRLYDAARLASDPFGEPLAEVEFEPFVEPVEWELEAPPGDYVLVISAYWPDRGNDAQYSFGIALP